MHYELIQLKLNPIQLNRVKKFLPKYAIFSLNWIVFYGEFREIQRSLGEIQRELAYFQNSFKRLLPAIL